MWIYVVGNCPQSSSIDQHLLIVTQKWPCPVRKIMEDATNSPWLVSKPHITIASGLATGNRGHLSRTGWGAGNIEALKHGKNGGPCGSWQLELVYLTSYLDSNLKKYATSTFWEKSYTAWARFNYPCFFVSTLGYHGALKSLAPWIQLGNDEVWGLGV